MSTLGEIPRYRNIGSWATNTRQRDVDVIEEPTEVIEEPIVYDEPPERKPKRPEHKVKGKYNVYILHRGARKYLRGFTEEQTDDMWTYLYELAPKAKELHVVAVIRQGGRLIANSYSI